MASQFAGAGIPIRGKNQKSRRGMRVMHSAAFLSYVRAGTFPPRVRMDLVAATAAAASVERRSAAAATVATAAIAATATVIAEAGTAVIAEQADEDQNDNPGIATTKTVHLSFLLSLFTLSYYVRSPNV